MYRLLGNTLNADMLAHILSHIPGVVTQPIETLSIYDGIGTGHVALEKLGCDVSYYAAEQDTKAILNASGNIQGINKTGDLGDIENDDFWDGTTPNVLSA
jgi:hypothetical protein